MKQLYKGLIFNIICTPRKSYDHLFEKNKLVSGEVGLTQRINAGRDREGSILY